MGYWYAELLNEEGCSCPLQGLPHPVSVDSLCFILCYTVGTMQTAISSNQAHTSRKWFTSLQLNTFKPGKQFVEMLFKTLCVFMTTEPLCPLKGANLSSLHLLFNNFEKKQEKKISFSIQGQNRFCFRLCVPLLFTLLLWSIFRVQTCLYFVKL